MLCARDTVKEKRFWERGKCSIYSLHTVKAIDFCERNLKNYWCQTMLIHIQVYWNLMKRSTIGAMFGDIQISICVNFWQKWAVLSLWNDSYMIFQVKWIFIWLQWKNVKCRLPKWEVLNFSLKAIYSSLDHEITSKISCIVDICGWYVKKKIIAEREKGWDFWNVATLFTNIVCCTTSMQIVYQWKKMVNSWTYIRTVLIKGALS